MSRTVYPPLTLYKDFTYLLTSLLTYLLLYLLPGFKFFEGFVHSPFWRFRTSTTLSFTHKVNVKLRPGIYSEILVFVILKIYTGDKGVSRQPNVHCLVLSHSLKSITDLYKFLKTLSS